MSTYLNRIYKKAFPYLILTPALITGGLIIVYPLVNAIILSLTSYTFFVPKYTWYGLKNYISLFTSPLYWEVIFNSIFIISISVAIGVLLGLAVSLLVNSDIYLRGTLRSFIFVIWIIPLIVVALLWMIIFNSEFGILNYILKEIGIIDKRISWFGGIWSAKFALIISYSWRGVPFFMVMLLAALQTIPNDIVDASRIDGTNSIQRFRYITFPYIRHVLLLSCLLFTMGLFQDITFIVVFTEGGPINATVTFAYFVYKTAFIDRMIGRATAIGVTWSLILLVLAILYVRTITKHEFIK